MECDFFFGAVEADTVEEPPSPDVGRTFRKVTRGVKVRRCGGGCSGMCNGHWNKAGNKFAALSEEGDEKESNEDDVEGDGKDGNVMKKRVGRQTNDMFAELSKDRNSVLAILEEGEEDKVDSETNNVWKEAVHKKKRKRVMKKEWKRVDLCTVEESQGKASMIKVDFQVAAVRKPLMSVKRICEKGNRVCFGPNGEDNYVENIKTNKRVGLRPNGKGSYLLDAKFKGGENISVGVDSGAEENVCPTRWGEKFGMTEPKAWLNFSGANGANIPHYGKRAIIMESTF